MGDSMKRNLWVKGAKKMRMAKRLVCGWLSVMLLLCLAACGRDNAADVMAGTWQRDKAVFLPYYKTMVDLVVVLNEDGTYKKTVTDYKTSEVLDREEGSWSFDGETLTCVKKNESATIRYTYDSESNTLENAGYTYNKIS